MPDDVNKNTRKSVWIELGDVIGWKYDEYSHLSASAELEAKSLLTILAVQGIRTASDTRLASIRSYNLHKELHDREATEHIDTPFNFFNVALYFSVLVSTVVFHQQNKEINIDTDKMYFEMRDAMNSLIIAVLRFEGERVSSGDFGITAGVSSGLLVYIFVFDLVHQIYFDMKTMWKNEKAIEEIQNQINIIEKTGDLNVIASPGTRAEYNQFKHAELIAKRDQLLTKRTELKLNLAWDIVYFGFLIAGASLAVAASTAAAPIGLTLITLGTALNQFKKWGMAIREWRKTINKCAEKTEYLNGLKATEDPEKQREINFKLIALGMSLIEDFSEAGIAKYREQQQGKIKKEIKTANKKIIFDSAWYALIITTIISLAATSAALTLFGLAAPVGLGVLVVGVLTYAAVKYGYEYYEKSTTKPLLTSDAGKGTTSAKREGEHTNVSPTVSPRPIDKHRLV